MSSIEKMLEEFSEVAHNPKKMLEQYIAQGKRVIGVGPYYVPEELVYAAHAIPFGVWGTVGPSVKSKEFFPPFYCSLCQTSLEMGLDHTLDRLSGIIVTGLCDTLKAFSQNWKAGVEGVPLIYVSQPQNRKIEAGQQYALASYTELKRQIEECCGALIDDDALASAISLYNEWRLAMRRFVRVAGEHPSLIGVAARTDVINAGYYQDKALHLAKVKELTAALEEEEASVDGFKRIVVSGIYEDIPALTAILDENQYAVVADDLAKESRSFALQVPEGGDPLKALADGWCGLDNDSILYDSAKGHIAKVVNLAKDSHAQGVLILLAKFCDPEEFDAPLISKACREAQIPCITIEIDQSTESYEQARTQLETFKDLL